MQTSIRQDYVISSSLVGVELIAACGGRKQKYNNKNKINASWIHSHSQREENNSGWIVDKDVKQNKQDNIWIIKWIVLISPQESQSHCHVGLYNLYSEKHPLSFHPRFDSVNLAIFKKNLLGERTSFKWILSCIFYCANASILFYFRISICCTIWAAVAELIKTIYYIKPSVTVKEERT